MNTKFISAKEVVAKIYNDLNLQEEGKFISIIEWIGEVLELIGYTEIAEDKYSTIEIQNYRGLLPCDFIYELSVNFNGYNTVYNTANQKHLKKELDEEGVNHAQYVGSPSYTITYPYINFTVRDCKLDLVYKGNKVDEEGFPLVPDHILVKESCVLYTMMKMMQAKYASGKISFNEFKAIKEEAMKTIDRATSKLAMPNPAKMQSIAQRWVRLIPNIQDFEENFSSAHTMQHNFKLNNG